MILSRQLSLDEIEIRLALAAGADKPAIAATISKNLNNWAARAGGRIGSLDFSQTPPERDPASHKLVRVLSRVRQ